MAEKEVSPSWKQKLDQMNQKAAFTDTAATSAQDYLISEDEVAMKHPHTGSLMKMHDDGCIDIFASETLGIRLDPTTNSINFFGDYLNFFGKQMSLNTKPDGLVWNGHYFNPQAYYESDTEKDQYLIGDKNYWVYSQDQGWHWERGEWRYKPMVPATGRTRYSEGMIQILSKMGLPVE